MRETRREREREELDIKWTVNYCEIRVVKEKDCLRSHFKPQGVVER